MGSSESSGIVEAKRNIPTSYESLINAAANGKINFSPSVGQIGRIVEGLLFNHSILIGQGKDMKQFFEGKTIIDLGCGINPEDSFLLRFIKACNAKSYIGVDMVIKSKAGEFEGMSTVFHKGDILAFLSKIEHLENTALILSGIDAEDSELSRQYFNAVSNELLRVTGSNTAIIIGPFTHHLDLESKFKIGKICRDRSGIYDMKVLLPKTHLNQEKPEAKEG
jgi:hypothetical protein